MIGDRMRLPRRFFLAAGAAVAAAGAASAQTAPNAAAATDARLGERAIGRPDAPVQVLEFFSLTCSHCAAFYRDTMPQVKQRLVEPGTVRFVYRDFPLDRLALAAAVVARSLPPERYEPFVGALLLAQDRWAFSRGGDPLEELAKLAALAGMARPQFDAAVRDETLARAILEGVQTAEREHGVRSTPSFVFRQDGRSRTQAGAVGFERFQQLVDEAKRA
jgi:protein-disulfide isomerase